MHLLRVSAGFSCALPICCPLLPAVVLETRPGKRRDALITVSSDFLPKQDSASAPYFNAIFLLEAMFSQHVGPPTHRPTYPPTHQPTYRPSYRPTHLPTKVLPSYIPTCPPANFPTCQPTYHTTACHGRLRSSSTSSSSSSSCSH